MVGEYKGSKTDLDVRQSEGYQKRTPVEQARNYAGLAQPNCPFYLVTNMTEWRLYAHNSSPDRYERWFLSDLSTPAHYWRFTSLLSEAAILGGKTLRWLQESEQQDKEINRTLYGEYQKMRWDSIVSLAKANPQLTAVEIIDPAQTLLDRILFIAFAEDNGLLPSNTFKTYATASATLTAWDSLKALFRAIDQGSRDNPQTIPAYNGGLFAPNPALENLDIANELIHRFNDLTQYDFGTEVRVTVLGHIFEQSVAELEQLREAAEAKPQSFIADLAKRIAPIESKGRSVTGKRKENGIVYTPDSITRFIVQRTLGCYLEAQQTGIRRIYETGKGEWCKKAPEGMATGRSVKGGLKDIALGEYLYWTAWQARLESIKVIDPSCGSGAFLVAAFDVFAPYYRELAQALRRLYPDTLEAFNGDRAILTHNLYGVDINAGAIEIAKLSLWLKTAKPGHKLDSLDGHLLCGNSLRFQPDSKSRWSSEHFGWNTTFKNILAKGGFDVVLGNPPYVRMEVLKPFKPYLSANYAVASDRADLYAYFYEIGLRLLKPGGCLGYISSSTFFKTGSGEPLRRYLLDNARLQTVVDFGDLQVFEGVTTYPAIVCLEKGKAESDHVLQFAVIHSEDQLATLDTAFIQSAADMPQSQLTAENWQLKGDVHSALRHKLMHDHKTLKEVYGSPCRGVVTGLNEAFVIDRTMRDRLIAVDPKSAELLKPFLEGKDLKQWRVETRDLYLLYIAKNRIDIDDYPAIKAHLLPFKDKLEQRATKQEWFELQQAQEAYMPFMEKPKIIYGHFSPNPLFSYEAKGSRSNDKSYFIPSGDQFLLGLLNSKPIWNLIENMCPAVRGGFYEVRVQYIETLPIPAATEAQKQAIAKFTELCQQAAEARYKKQKDLRGIIPSLHPNKRVEKLSTALQNWWQLDFSAFQMQIKKEFKLDIPVKERGDWKDQLETGAQEIERLTLEIAKHERELNAAVYALFNLTTEEIALIEQG
ncbi:Eco57I restriction-modification methylase domain-containing protein [Methylobacter tundripaludum]|uniref:Eco57I restriction-modification methylase domain-containing protein n=1 Tax=Methylobacter tundripaludum TaxID=173365 RepID=UPI0001E5114A|nr:N-6 DNA methylase [Methylobacter tundripaludum]